MFSILIPSTLSNLKYLNLCLKSLKKNSKYNHEIIVHISDVFTNDIRNKINYNINHLSTSKEIFGICKSLNLLCNKASKEYVVYAHDDMYFCPGWDEVFEQNIKLYKNQNFLLSGTMIQSTNAHVILDCGNDIDDFDEKKLLKKYKEVNFYDFQGTTWAPTLISKKLWASISGLSEEFDPGLGSDPDMNMKLWKRGVRIFKGLNECKVYHFGSLNLRKNKKIKKNRGNHTFLLKWGLSIKSFKKYYMESDKPFLKELPKYPTKNLFYFIDLFKDKLAYIYHKILYKIK